MSKDGTNRLQELVTKAVDYCRGEYDMSYAETYGVLFVIMMNLNAEFQGEENEDED